MKINKALIIVLCLLSVSLMGFSYKSMAGKAEVATERDIYVFYMSEPTAEYEVLGEVGSRPVWVDLPSELVSSVTRKAQKRYKDAEGVIFLDRNMRRASVIKFK